MVIQFIQVPFDSGHRAKRMGAGPTHILKNADLRRLVGFDGGPVETIEPQSAFATEIGSAFELHRSLSAAVERAARAGRLPLVLSGNCNASMGTVAGLQGAGLADGLGVIWFDGHGDSNTPETFTGGFLDAMGLSTLTGRCWQALAATVPNFQPLSDEVVALVGGHGTDAGSASILNASRVSWVQTPALRKPADLTALASALNQLERHGVRKVYLHLDVDVLDADFARANEFAPSEGLLPDEMGQCWEAIAQRFEIVAAGIASYDPSFDGEGRVLAVAIGFLERVASAHAQRATPSS